MRILYAAVLLLFVAAVLIFCVQNLASVSVAFLGWKASLPIALLFLLVYLLGMFSGWGLWSLLRQSVNRARETKE